jgi:hypothetical protein
VPPSDADVLVVASLAEQIESDPGHRRGFAGGGNRLEIFAWFGVSPSQRDVSRRGEFLR